MVDADYKREHDFALTYEYQANDNQTSNHIPSCFVAQPVRMKDFTRTVMVVDRLYERQGLSSTSWLHR